MSITRLSFVALFLLNFSIPVYADGSVVFLLFDDGTMLLGKEPRTCRVRQKDIDAWSTHGGGKKANETFAEAAYRELQEETGHYTFGNGEGYNFPLKLSDIEAAEHSDILSTRGNPNVAYFLRIPGEKPDIEKIKKNAQRAKEEFGQDAHVEKTDWAYFEVKAVMKTPWKGDILPGTNEIIYASTINHLKKDKAQEILKKYLKDIGKL